MVGCEKVENEARGNITLSRKYAGSKASRANGPGETNKYWNFFEDLSHCSLLRFSQARVREGESFFSFSRHNQVVGNRRKGMWGNSFSPSGSLFQTLRSTKTQYHANIPSPHASNCLRRTWDVTSVKSHDWKITLAMCFSDTPYKTRV